MQAVLGAALGASAYSRGWKATPLGGGVSSDIFRVDAGTTTLCVKRALPKLKVAADWRVPVDRNRSEAAWLRVAADIVPGCVPKLLAEDPDAGAFAMEWLPPGRFPVWKHLLRDGAIESATAAKIGDVLGRLHAATAQRPDLGAAFATDALFHALRIEPYLLATARVHEDLTAQLVATAERTAATRLALVHGDFSPKNLLIGEAGPVVVDAECAWWGDPAFDLAFVLNHLLLKGAWRPQWRSQYVGLYRALVDAYLPHVDWEPWTELEGRCAALLPALMLARIDGKSPVEYLAEPPVKDEVRTFARALLVRPAASLEAIAARWA